MQKLFVLEPVFDDVRFCRFDFEDSGVYSFDKMNEILCPRNHLQEFGEIRSLKSSWPTPKVSGSVSESNHFPCVYPYPVLSDLAVAELAPLLNSCGELLDLETPDGEYWLYHITSVEFSLNENESDVIFEHESKRFALSVDYFSFPAGSEFPDVFRISQWPEKVIVSEKFFSAVLSSGLTGFNMFQIWPLGADSIWQQNLVLDGTVCKQIASFWTATEPVQIELKLRSSEPSVVEARMLEKLLQFLNLHAQEIRSCGEVASESSENSVIISISNADPSKVLEWMNNQSCWRREWSLKVP